MQIKLKQFVLAASVASVFAAASSYGQVAKTEYDPGDLILGFQVVGQSNIIEVNLGVASLYRDRTTDLLNIVDLSSTLTTLAGFGGTTWYNNTNLFFGAVGMRSVTNSAGSGTAQIGANDPNRTLYFTQSRAAVGTVGVANSGTPAASAANAASVFQGFGNTFDNTLEVNGLYAGSNSPDSTWEEYNPFISGTIQDTAFGGGVNNGLQQQFGSGSFGTYGAAGAVEGVLDLWRQSAFGASPNGNVTNPEFAATETPTYQGSFTIDQAGQVSYIAASAVPEPSSALLLGSATLLGGFIRRRNA